MNQYDLAISQEYNKLPFHNWPHGEHTANRAMLLLWLQYQSHIHPMEIWSKFHNAGHPWWIDIWHEEHANEIAQRLLSKWNFSQNYRNKVQELISGTELSKRWELETKEKQIIADADIALIWGNYLPFLEDSAKFLIENDTSNFITDFVILDFFRNKQPEFFSYLTWITNDTSNPFLTKEAQTHFPHFSRNVDTIAQDVQEYPQKIINIVRDAQATYIINNSSSNTLNNY